MRRFSFLILPLVFSCAGTVQRSQEVQFIQRTVSVEAKKEESLYDKEVQEKILQLLRQEPTPLKVPDTVIRVLILPYVDEKGNLVSQKYIFFRAEEGKWILGEYLLQRGKPIRELRPLEENGK
ncbi:MAG: TraV family lipoprotein [Aquificaceae bacterium]